MKTGQKYCFDTTAVCFQLLLPESAWLILWFGVSETVNQLGSLYGVRESVALAVFSWAKAVVLGE